MDFSLDEDAAALAELAGQVLGDAATPDRLAAVEAAAAAAGPGTAPNDGELWAAMAAAGLLGVGVPEQHGGNGVGLVGLGALLEHVGRTAVAVPALATLGWSVPALAQFAAPELAAGLLPGIAAGELVATAALAEPLGDPVAPATVARPDGAGGWLLDGTKSLVPAGTTADVVLVPARRNGGRGDRGDVGVFVVPTDAEGLRVVAQPNLTGGAYGELSFDAVRVAGSALLGGGETGPDGAAVLAWTLARARAATCAVMVGVVDAAVALTADYTRTRQQFNQPLAGFQAVRQRIADSYVDSRAVRLTALEALWRLDAGLPAEAEVAVAKFVAADAGRRVVRAATHLHGGAGVDRSYPLHRYYLLAKQLELSLGGATDQLRELGRLLAA